MPLHPPNPTSKRRRLPPGTFVLLLIWGVLSVLLLLWTWERRAALRTLVVFRATVDGEAASDGEIAARLGGQPVASGARARPGWRALAVEGPDVEPQHRTVFVWYGRNDLGELKLVRSRGNLEITIEPPPKELRLAGKHFSTTTSNTPARFDTVPVGEYRVTAAFGHFTDERTVAVRRNETSQLQIKPPVGTLDLSAEPRGAEFKLTAAQFAGLDLSGKAPAQLSELPAGEYHLRVWRGEYAKDLNIAMKAGETNRQNVVFDYGEVKLLTKPEGAGVFDAFNEVGKTPKTISELKPGQYEFRLQLEGYHPVAVSVSVRGKDTIVISTNLVSVRYTEAMNAARSVFDSRFGDYRSALARVEEALQSQPGDPEAMTLKVKIEAAMNEQAAKAAEAKKQVEAQQAEEKKRLEAEAQKAAMEARKREAEETFRKLVEREKSAGLFETRVWPVKGDVAKVREALLRMLRQQGVRWKLGKEMTLNETNVAFYCPGKGFLSSTDKWCLALITQMAPDEVYLYAKFFEYATERNGVIGLFPMDKAHGRAVGEEFWHRLSKELEPR